MSGAGHGRRNQEGGAGVERANEGDGGGGGANKSPPFVNQGVRELTNMTIGREVKQTCWQLARTRP